MGSGYGWRKPGKERPGISATTGQSADGVDRLYVFSTSTQFEPERPYAKFAAYTLLQHHGDYSAAAKQLGVDGYGTQHAPTIITLDTIIEADTDDPIKISTYDQAVQRRFADLRVNEDAKLLLAVHKAGEAHPLQAINLTEFLTQPDETEQYRITGLWPAQGRVLLAAAAKAGKTTIVVANLLPSLVGGRAFLGEHSSQPVTRRVTYFNMEVGERIIRTWMRRAGIINTDQVNVVNLRGKASALTLATQQGRQRFAAFLRNLETEAVILDPLAPLLATLNLDENSNTEVATFFSWWSEVLQLAEVTDDLIVHHTGHATNDHAAQADSTNQTPSGHSQKDSAPTQKTTNSSAPPSHDSSPHTAATSKSQKKDSTTTQTADTSPTTDRTDHKARHKARSTTSSTYSKTRHRDPRIKSVKQSEATATRHTQPSRRWLTTGHYSKPARPLTGIRSTSLTPQNDHTKGCVFQCVFSIHTCVCIPFSGIHLHTPPQYTPNEQP